MVFRFDYPDIYLLLLTLQQDLSQEGARERNTKLFNQKPEVSVLQNINAKFNESLFFCNIIFLYKYNLRNKLCFLECLVETACTKKYEYKTCVYVFLTVILSYKLKYYNFNLYVKRSNRFI